MNILEKRQQVKEQIEKYLEMLRKMSKEGTNFNSYSVMLGRKYARIVSHSTYGSQRFVHTFIDMDNGDILKAAGWKAPAPNPIRGSIFAADLGRSVVNEYGAEYLR